MMMRYINIVFLILATAVLGCNEDNTRYAFLGDSIIEGWDLNESFPALITENYGLGGSGIAHVESYKGAFWGKVAVVLCGTNDLAWVNTQLEAQRYALRYVNAVNGLGARRAYIISILPRDFSIYSDGDVETLCYINKVVRQLCDESGNLTFIDAFPLFAIAHFAPSPQYFYDGLHPNSYGYCLLTSLLNGYLL